MEMLWQTGSPRWTTSNTSKTLTYGLHSTVNKDSLRITAIPQIEGSWTETWKGYIKFSTQKIN